MQFLSDISYIDNELNENKINLKTSIYQIDGLNIYQYFNCTTPSDEEIKQINSNGFFKRLKEGDYLFVKFQNSNTINGVKLKIDNFEAISIKKNGVSDIIDTNGSTRFIGTSRPYWNSGDLLMLVYIESNKPYWAICDYREDNYIRNIISKNDNIINDVEISTYGKSLITQNTLISAIGRSKCIENNQNQINNSNYIRGISIKKDSNFSVNDTIPSGNIVLIYE